MLSAYDAHAMQMSHAGRILGVVLGWAAVVSEQVIRVSIDVKPGDAKTTIEPDRGGMVPVAILTTAQFDASTVDPASIRIGPTGTEAEIFRSMPEDINRDKRTDLLLLVRLQDMKVQCGDRAIRLTGKTKGGVDIEGSEAVTTEGCGK
jgi:hypothetical protein